jgi:hypothetical protein
MSNAAEGVVFIGAGGLAAPTCQAGRGTELGGVP